MWLLPSARLFDSDKQGYLVRVAQRYPSRNQVQVHVLNTRSKARRTGWELLWGDNGDWSKEKRTPVTDKWKPTFKPWIEVVEFEDLVPAVVTVTGGDPKNSKDKPKMYSISQAFHDKYVKNVTPPTWKEHLKTLRQKEHDPPPKKGVAARMRSAPTGKALRGSKQEPMPQPASAKNARAARLAKRSGSPSVATVTEKQKQGVLLLIRATQALYDTVGAHGYQRREGKIATFPF